jgi:hypothetical protein
MPRPRHLEPEIRSHEVENELLLRSAESRASLFLGRRLAVGWPQSPLAVPGSHLRNRPSTPGRYT